MNNTDTKEETNCVTELFKKLDLVMAEGNQDQQHLDPGACVGVAASDVARSEWVDVCVVYAKMKHDLPYILDGIESILGDTFIRPPENDAWFTALTALHELKYIRQYHGPLQEQLSLYEEQLLEIRQVSDGIRAALRYKARSPQEILPSNNQDHP